MDTKDWIYAISIGVTFVVGVANLAYTFRTAKRRDFISTVTSERVKWIENLRQNVSKYTGKVHSYFHLKCIDKAKAQELLVEIDVLSYLIQLQLNPKEHPDDGIQRLLESISNTAAKPTFDDLQRDIKALTALTQELLKKEWEKVKRESQTGRV